jgi:hypothetical protein
MTYEQQAKPLTAEDIVILQDDLAKTERRLDAALKELRCPECGCSDAIDAQSQECGCDSPLCERTIDDGTLAESWLRLWAEIRAQGEAIEVLARELRKRRLPWWCSYCGSLYAEYVNGCPRCHFGEPGTATSVKIDTDGIEAARIETDQNPLASAAIKKEASR